MLLYSVRFLCSVVAAFARLVRGLRKAMGATLLYCSPRCPVPVSPGAGLATTAPLTSWRWMAPRHHVVVGDAQGALDDDDDDDNDRRVLMEPLVTSVAAPAAPVVVVAACNGSVSVDVEVEQVETRKKAVAWAARRRPSMLVIPVAPDAGEMPSGWGVAVAEKEEAEVEVAGDGFWLASRRGARHAMEDGYGVITQKTGADSQLAFFGVYDGHGGRAAVDFVSDRLGKNVIAAVLAATATTTQEDGNASPADAVTAAIRAAYLATDSEFLGQGVRGGSCATTALVKDGDLYVANIGDCRAVMNRDGAAIAVTSDHTAAREDERARIESSGGYVSCGSNGVWRVQDCLAVSRAFGDGSLKRWVISEPEITRVPVIAGCEFLVVASDGLWNKVSNQEAVDAVSRSSAAGCCKELVDMARSRGSRDDITVMVVDLKRFACTIG